MTPGATILPVAVRELRVASRRRQTYWGRLAFPLMGVLICTVTLWSVIFLGARQRDGRMLFQTLTMMAFVFSVMSGMATIDVITSEKREGTLGLLFLTHLKGYDVVFGKLAPAWLMSFYGLLASLPVLAIPMLLGGVGMMEFWRVAIALLVVNLFSLSAALVVSTFARDISKGTGAFSMMMAFFAFIATDLLLRSPLQQWSPFIANTLALFTPRMLFQMASGTPVRGVANPFVLSIGAHLAATAILLAIACVAVPRCWHEKATLKPIRGWARRWNEWRFGNSKWRKQFLDRICSINPIFWLRARHRLNGAAIVIAMLGLLAIWVAGWVGTRIAGPPPGMRAIAGMTIAMAPTTAIFLFMTMGVIASAGQALSEDRKSGALELVTSTALTVSQILRGQWMAIARSALPYGLAAAAAMVLAANCVMTIARIETHETRALYELFWAGLTKAVVLGRLSDEEFGAFAFGLGLICIPLSIAALGWSALWGGMRVQKGPNAAGQAFFLTFGLPWPFTILILGGANYARRKWGWPITDTEVVVPLTFFAVFFVNASVITWATRRALRKNFRKWATERHNPDAAAEWWRSIFRKLAYALHGRRPPGDRAP